MGKCRHIFPICFILFVEKKLTVVCVSSLQYLLCVEPVTEQRSSSLTIYESEMQCSFFHQWFPPVAQTKHCLIELYNKTIFLPYFCTNNINSFIYTAAVEFIYTAHADCASYHMALYLCWALHK